MTIAADVGSDNARDVSCAGSSSESDPKPRYKIDETYYYLKSLHGGYAVSVPRLSLERLINLQSTGQDTEIGGLKGPFDCSLLSF